MRMRQLLVIISVLLLRQVTAQQVVVLSVEQPPELSYSVTENDTTIRKGESVVLGSGLTVCGGSGEYSYTWSPANSLDNPLVKNPVATPEDTVTYLVTVTDGNGCRFAVPFTVNVKREAVKSILAGSLVPFDVLIFPNPGNDEFRIYITGPPCHKMELAVTDFSGRIFLKEILRNFEGERTVVLHPGLSGGIYLVRISSEKVFISKELIIR